MSPKHAVEYLLSPLPTTATTTPSTTATTTPSTTATTTPSTTPTTTRLHYDAVYTHQRRRMAVDGYNPHLYAQKTPAPPPPHRRPYDPNRYTPPPTTARPLQYDAVYDYRFDHNRYTSTTADWREKYNLHRMARDSPEPVPSTTGRHRTLEELRARILQWHLLFPSFLFSTGSSPGASFFGGVSLFGFVFRMQRMKEIKGVVLFVRCHARATRAERWPLLAISS